MNFTRKIIFSMIVHSCRADRFAHTYSYSAFEKQIADSILIQTDLQVINGIVRLSHFLVCLNSSANFLIYYVYGSKLRNTWLETYEPIWSFFLKIFNFRNVTTFRHSNLERKRPDDEFDTILPDQETERIAKFRATHGPTMV